MKAGSGGEADFAKVAEGFDLGQARALAHFLGCPVCAAGAVGALMERFGTDLVVAGRRDDNYPRPESGAMKELSARSLSDWHRGVESGEVSRETLVELVLRASREKQLADPEASLALAREAGSLACEEGSDLGLAHVSEAYGLATNAWRLAGKPESADGIADMELAGLPPEHQASVLRILGLLHWERGELNEGREHLESAARGFGTAGLIGEEATTMTLLGLLAWERGLDVEATVHLLASLAVMPAGERPWLEARGMLTLAETLAYGGKGHFGRQLLQAARSRYGTNEIGNEAIEQLWLEGRVATALGDWQDATTNLTLVRELGIVGGRLAEAALATLDLLRVLIEVGEAEEVVEARIGEIEERFEREECIARVVGVLRGWWRTGPDGQVYELAILHALASTELTSFFRANGPRPRPMPFVG